MPMQIYIEEKAEHLFKWQLYSIGNGWKRKEGKYQKMVCDCGLTLNLEHILKCQTQAENLNKISKAIPEKRWIEEIKAMRHRIYGGNRERMNKDANLLREVLNKYVDVTHKY